MGVRRQEAGGWGLEVEISPAKQPVSDAAGSSLRPRASTLQPSCAAARRV
jgi:hypothetical protein